MTYHFTHATIRHLGEPGALTGIPHMVFCQALLRLAAARIIKNAGIARTEARRPRCAWQEFLAECPGRATCVKGAILNPGQFNPEKRASKRTFDNTAGQAGSGTPLEHPSSLSKNSKTPQHAGVLSALRQVFWG